MPRRGRTRRRSARVRRDPSRIRRRRPTAKANPTSCANLSGGTGSFSLTGTSRGATTLAKISPYGCLRGPASAPIANTSACTPRMTAAAIRLTLLTSSAMTRTAVVTHAAKRGPRTSTWSTAGAVVPGDPSSDVMEVSLLLLERAGCEQARQGLLRASARDRAAELSSYNNNSNNPRRGTGRLRGAW